MKVVRTAEDDCGKASENLGAQENAPVLNSRMD